MLATIRKMGNSQGIIIPKPLLQQVGLKDRAEILIEGDALVLRKPKTSLREGWAEAAKKIAEAGDDTLVLGEFPNEEDETLEW
jgi:antitoxin MazE